MEILGYKAFAIDGTNINGKTFEEGKKYHMDGTISFGTKGNGYHFALYLEDTIRYAIDEYPGECLIAQVIGSGDIVESFDDYYGYYDIYSCSDLEIVRYLSREEILNYAVNLNSFKLERFVSHFKLTEDEISLFYGKHIMVDKAIEYFQRGNKGVYSEESPVIKSLNLK